MNEEIETNGSDQECPGCGASPHDRAKRNGGYRELRECPSCSALKCCVCDMGDNCACAWCEDTDD